MINNRTRTAVYQTTKDGNYYCGDGYFYEETDGQFMCVLADGLGSGEYARESAQIVVDIAKENIDANANELVKKCNPALMGKRGVVLGLLKFDFAQQTYTFSSIGNIGLVTISTTGRKKRNIPHSGYLAGYERPFKVARGDLEPGTMFVVFSDGVTDRDLSKNFMLYQNAQELIDAFADQREGSFIDDTTMIAIKYLN